MTIKAGRKAETIEWYVGGNVQVGRPALLRVPWLKRLACEPSLLACNTQACSLLRDGARGR